MKKYASACTEGDRDLPTTYLIQGGAGTPTLVQSEEALARSDCPRLNKAFLHVVEEELPQIERWALDAVQAAERRVVSPTYYESCNSIP